METVIERQRRQHEECERLENALSEELLLKKQTVCTHGSQFKYCNIFVYVLMIVLQKVLESFSTELHYSCLCAGVTIYHIVFCIIGICLQAKAKTTTRQKGLNYLTFNFQPKEQINSDHRGRELLEVSIQISRLTSIEPRIDCQYPAE